MDLLELRIVKLNRLSQSLARELRTPQGGDEALSVAERHAYRKLVNRALRQVHRGWSILSRARRRHASQGRRGA